MTVAQTIGDNAWNALSGLFQQMGANWEKQPSGLVLIIMLDTFCNLSVLVPL